MLEPLSLRLVRHGETDWNAEGRIQGHIDIALNQRGRDQAADLAGRLAGKGAELVLSSDLSRARETAEIIAAELGIPVRCDPRLRERNLGDLQGKTAADLGNASSHGFVARMVDNPANPPPGAETIEAFRARIAGFLDDLTADPPAADVVLVTHGGAIRAALLAVLGTDRRDVVARIGNCSVIRLLVDGERTRFIDEEQTEADAAHSVDESVTS